MQYVPQKSPFEVSAPLRAYLEREFASIARVLNQPAPELFELTPAEDAAGLTATDIDQSYPFGHALRYDDIAGYSTNATPGLNKAIAIAAEVVDGVRFYYPAIGTSYRCTSKPDDIESGIMLEGDGRRTQFLRDYNGASPEEGLFNFRTGGEFSVVRDMSILSASGRSGGSLISVVADATNNVSWGLLDNIRFTTQDSDTHDYNIYFDGSAKSSDPVGIRLMTVRNCELFGGLLGSAFLKSTMSLLLMGCRTFQAGGTHGKIVVSGVSGGVLSYYTHIVGGFIAGLDAEHAEQLHVSVSRISGDVNLAASVVDPYVRGHCTGTVTDNATYTNRVLASTLHTRNVRADKLMAGGVSSTVFAIETLGGIMGRTSGTETNVGHVGVPGDTEVDAGETFTFTCGSAKKFVISTQNGDAADVFATYKSATITIDDPDSHFVNSASPGAGETGIWKSANSHVVNIVNGTAITMTYGISVLGNVSAVTDPA